MRGALYDICAIYRRWSENARRRANGVRVKRPLIRLRHPSTRFARSGQALLPQLKSAGGEGLSIGGTAENEPSTTPHRPKCRHQQGAGNSTQRVRNAG